ncbi:uncharacterized protein LOC127122938 [Lathyrus oleraceus]|uniref:uncharacterized protein LOC127122938 n=1 Tax=Pisum sativum TaxID=3888 RepID=UPI0021D1101B|nr:uncharacterized protein LOC127122938 [Pisum sativum]
MTSAKRESTSQGGLVDQLKETCKELENGIRVAKARKEALEVLICSLEKQEVEKAGKDSNTRPKSQSSGSSGSFECSKDEDEGEGKSKTTTNTKETKTQGPRVQAVESDDGNLLPDTSKQAKKKKKQAKTSDATSQPKVVVTKVQTKKPTILKVLEADLEFAAKTTPERLESDNSSPGAEGPKDGAEDILDQAEDVSNDEKEQDEDRSMFYIPPVDDQNEHEEDDEENDANDEENSGEMPKAIQSSDAAKELKAPSNGNTDASSLEELKALKWSKPTKYLKAIISDKGSSNDKCSSSSTMFGGYLVSKSADDLLKNIKEKALDVDLLQVLENDPSACFGINDLLKRVDILTTSLEVVDVIIEIGLLIDQITTDLHCIKYASTKIQNKTETQAAKWEVVTESTTRVS